jgi:hypothetical protein
MSSCRSSEMTCEYIGLIVSSLIVLFLRMHGYGGNEKCLIAYCTSKMCIGLDIIDRLFCKEGKNVMRSFIFDCMNHEFNEVGIIK